MQKMNMDLFGYARAALIAALALGATSLHAAEEDPWEGVNRVVFRFNDAVDTYTLKPLAQGYQKVTPDGKGCMAAGTGPTGSVNTGSGSAVRL